MYLAPGLLCGCALRIRETEPVGGGMPHPVGRIDPRTSLKIKQNPIVDGIAVQPRVGPDLAQSRDETNRLDRGSLMPVASESAIQTSNGW